MTRSRLAAMLVLAAIALAVPRNAAAQATTGELAGRVTDQTGQTVTGATVIARDPATGFQRSTTSTETGDFIITLLPPGRYSVSAERQGFKKVIRENVDVLVGTRAAVALELAVGAVTEAVTVNVGTPLVDTTRSDLGGVVTSKDIADLPLLNRTFANLSVVMPEARPAGNFDPTKTRVGNFAMNGGDGRQLDVNVDGGDNKDNVVGSLLQNFAYESIQEFQVLQHRWTAESGRAVGGVVNVITKSGTNALRGSGLFTFRSEDMMAKDFFQKRGAVRAAVQALGIWRIGGRADRPRQALFLRRPRAVRRALWHDRGPRRRHHSAGGSARRTAGRRHPDAVRRHAADDQGRPAVERPAVALLPLLDAEERVAERSGRQSRR